MRRQLLMGAVFGLATLVSLPAVAEGVPATVAVAQSAVTPPPATAFARRAAISSVRLSSDGSHIIAVISPDGERRAVAVWKTADLQAAPFLIGTDPRSEIIGARFIKDDRILVTTQQMVQFDMGGSVRPSYRTRTQVLDLQGNPVRVNLRFDGLSTEQQAYVGIGRIISTLPADPQSVLVSDPVKGDIYKVNLYTGSAERLQRGSSRFSSEQTDLNGEIRARSEIEFDNGAIYVGTWLRDAQGQWAEHFRSYARDRNPISIVGFSNDPNVVFVAKVPEGGDHTAIFEYDIANRRLGEEVFSHPVFDASGLTQSSDAADFGEMVAVGYNGERSRTVWADPRIEAIDNLARRAFSVSETPMEWTDNASGRTVRIQVATGALTEVVSTDRARERAIVVKSGPDTPPEYYVFQNGRFSLLGRAYPELQDAKLGDMTLVQYPARDGMQIPGLLTKPDPEVFGPGPYPAIVVPHGGPWARDDATWDLSGWSQYFAARGYAVLQPQFRGSDGWGAKLWRAGDRQWGRAMQDDVDDGVAYLIAQGVTQPGKVAIHGYSYGGYSAMIASTRPNPVFTCAIAGAGPATIDLFKKGTYNSRFLREFQHPTAEGIDPLSEIANVSIPVYLYTGDRDTVVVPAESRSFAAALERAGKRVKLEILPNMEHTLNTWTPANTALILTSVEQFLRDDCGLPGAQPLR